MKISILSFLLISSLFCQAQTKFDIYFNKNIPQLEFAASEFSKTAINERLSADISKINTTKPFIAISVGNTEAEKLAQKLKIEIPEITKPQSYYIKLIKLNGANSCVVVGYDANGAMYGALDVAEAIKLGKLDLIKQTISEPKIAERGIKFNIPLDLRTPSYTDCGDAAQANIPNMWDMAFWTTMLDNMARNRYNLISLWSLHPFPSMVKVPEFPEVALNDVWRTTYPLNDDFDGVGSDAVKPVMLENYEVVKKITIDEKIKFWQDVMQYGKDRGIDFYVFTWNIFTYGAEGKHGIVCNRSSDTTISYFRTSVREMIKTYPLLAGMGITAGEHMMKEGKHSKENWLWQTYGEGINDALKLQPDRKFRLIHRFHWSAQSEIMSEFKDLLCPLDFSFKYSIAHMYSMTNPPFVNELLPNLAPGMKTWLTVRNDDIYSFRWGNPDYAREYVLAIPPADKIAGYYMGPDGYTWGREYLSTEPETPRQTVIEKQWYSFMLWGRLSFDPTISNQHFESILANHFKEVPSDKLFKAWQEASNIFPEITKFFWGDIDERWLPEACCRRKSNFYTVEHFIKQPVMPESGNITIIDWREKLLANQAMNGKTPLEVAASLKDYAQKSLALVTELRPLQGNNKELRLTIGDIESFAHLGNYYAEKILGAANLAMYDTTSDAKYQQLSIGHLETALKHWEAYAKSYTAQYVQPIMYNRVKLVDIPGKFRDAAAYDIEIARNWKVHSITRVDPKGADTPFKK